MNILAALARDPNIDPALRRVLDTAHDKAAPRRFNDEPMSGFGDIGDVGSERWREVRDQEHADQLRDERRS